MMSDCRWKVKLLSGLIFLFLLAGSFAGAVQENSYVLYLKGLTAIEENDFAAAEGYLKEALRIDPKSSPVWNALGKVYLQEGNLNEAVKAYRKAVSLSPQSREPYYGLGAAYLRLKKYSLARLQYEKLIEIHPEEKDAYLVLADLYTGTGLIHRAVSTYEKILKFLPDKPVILYNLSVLLVQQKDYKSARGYLDRTIELAPNFIPARNLLAKTYQDTGNLPAAETAYKEVLVLSPNDPIALANLTRIYFEKERWPEAAGALEKMTDSKNPELLRLLGFAYYKSEDYQKALSAFQQSLTLRDDSTTKFYIAMTLDKLERDTEAIQELRKVVEQNPDDHSALNYLGYTLVERNENLEEAERLIKKAVSLEPENGAYLDSLGWLYFKKGNFSFARYYLLKAARYEEDPEIYGHLAELYKRLGDAKKEEYYRKKSKAIQKKPTN